MEQQKKKETLATIPPAETTVRSECARRRVTRRYVQHCSVDRGAEKKLCVHIYITAEPRNTRRTRRAKWRQIRNAYDISGVANGGRDDDGDLHTHNRRMRVRACAHARWLVVFRGGGRRARQSPPVRPRTGNLTRRPFVHTTHAFGGDWWWQWRLCCSRGEQCYYDTNITKL